MKGHFIVFEGIDGCGKTTQITELTNWLPKSGLMPKGTTLHVTREPGGTSLGNQLRELLLHPPIENSPHPITELLMYAADRAQHVSEIIKPALDKGDWIISDRFSGSTVSYQGYGRGLNFELIHQLELIATQSIVPDLTFWLDLPIEKSVSRRENATQDRIEAEGADFLKKVSQGFEEIANKRNWTRIPADLEKDLIHQKIQETLFTYLSIIKR